MTNQEALRLLRATRSLLVRRGLCGLFLVGQPTICGRTLGHSGTCGVNQ